MAHKQQKSIFFAHLSIHGDSALIVISAGTECLFLHTVIWELEVIKFVVSLSCGFQNFPGNWNLAGRRAEMYVGGSNEKAWRWHIALLSVD